MQPITHDQLKLICALDSALTSLLSGSAVHVLVGFDIQTSSNPLNRFADTGKQGRLPSPTVFSAKGWMLPADDNTPFSGDSVSPHQATLHIQGQPVGVIQLWGMQADEPGDILLKDAAMMIEATLAQHCISVRYAAKQDDIAQLTAQSPSLRYVQQQVSRLARVDLPVQISGRRHQDISSVVRALHKIGSFASDDCVWLDCGACCFSDLYDKCRQMFLTGKRAMVFLRNIDALNSQDYNQLCSLWFPVYPGQTVTVRLVSSSSSPCNGSKQAHFPWLLFTLPEPEQRQEDHQRFVDAMQEVAGGAGTLPEQEQGDGASDEAAAVSLAPGELLATQVLNKHHKGITDGHKALNEALDLLGESFGNRVTLQQIAAKVFVSPTHLSFLFRKHLGISFKQLLLQIRIERSKQLLRDPDRAVTDISHQVGFHDLSHFEKTFRKLVGKNPGNYRGSIRPNSRQSQRQA